MGLWLYRLLKKDDLMTLDFSYDPDNDIMIINGRKYTGKLFRVGFEPTEEGKCFKTLLINGILTISVQDHRDTDPEELGIA